MNIDGFDSLNGYKCSDVYKFEKTNSFSIKRLEIIFFPEGSEWKSKLLPIEIGKNLTQMELLIFLFKKIIMLP